MKDRIIVALDVDNFEDAESLVKKLSSEISIFKIGKELFTSCGPKVVDMVHGYNAKVFLDLKFHDIPNTVQKAIRSVKKLGVWMCNVHASGGRKMLEASSGEKGDDLIVIGVTVLTSMDQEALDELGVSASVKDHVIKLAQLSKEAGLNGVVASGLEAPMIREACGGDFLIITPGVRPEWASTGDQKRVLTPKKAFENGADYIVVGRPITEASDPKEAAKKILNELG